MDMFCSGRNERQRASDTLSSTCRAAAHAKPHDFSLRDVGAARPICADADYEDAIRSTGAHASTPLEGQICPRPEVTTMSRFGIPLSS
jgi:hypothetical protein